MRSLVLGAAMVSTLALAGCGLTTSTSAGAGPTPAPTHAHKKTPAPKPTPTPAKHGLAALQWHILKVAPAHNALPVGPYWPVAVELSITNPTGTAVSLVKNNSALWGVFPVNPGQPWTADPYTGDMKGPGSGPAITETPALFPNGGLTAPDSTTLTPEVVPAHRTMTGWVLLATAHGVKQTELVLLPHAMANSAGTPIPIAGTAFTAP